MHASTSTILNVFLCVGWGGAQVIPHQVRNEMAESPAARNASAPATPVMADPAAVAAAEASGAPPAGGGAAANAAGGTANALCAQGSILAQGIALNIADQQQELSTVNSMAAILAANPVDTAAYGAARTDLLRFINNGIAIREMNQLITPQGSQATPGIATVANAQLTELGLANQLTAQGSDNVAGNKQIVQTLQMDFQGGIMQNMKNMAAAMSACGGPAAAPAAPAAPPAAAPQAEPAPATGAAGEAGGEMAAPAQNVTASSSTSSSGAKGSEGAGAGKMITNKVDRRNELPSLVSRSAKFVV